MEASLMECILLMASCTDSTPPPSLDKKDSEKRMMLSYAVTSAAYGTDS